MDSAILNVAITSSCQLLPQIRRMLVFDVLDNWLPTKNFPLALFVAPAFDIEKLY